MSKQSEAKKRQGYDPKPWSCTRCEHFTCDSVYVVKQYRKERVDKNLRCKLGGFAVKKLGTCNEWQKAQG